MIVLLSPAKALNFQPVSAPRTQVRFKSDTSDLAKVMKKKSAADLMELMHISQKLGDLNQQRFQQYTDSHTKQNAKQAIFAFDGDVYRGLKADSFTEKQLEFAQKHVRILSGFYGLLRPFDTIQPYRLEMGTKLKTSRGRSLYDFWGEQLTRQVNSDLAATGKKAIINLASEEYFKALQPRNLNGDLYTITFKEYRGDQLKFISFSAKKARGYMTHYIVKNKITDPAKLKGFDLEGYRYDDKHSHAPLQMTFTR